PFLCFLYYTSFSLFFSFFQSSRHHRYLHSFPTRRSSDLVKSSTVNSSKSSFSKVNESLSDKFSNSPILSVINGPSSTMAFGIGSDRKSTRLNSSHVSISYAVFCLKKKN